MRLAAPVQHPDNPQHELLKRGYALDAAVLERLRDLRIDYLYVDYPDLDDLDKHLAVVLSAERQIVYKSVRDTVCRVQRLMRPAVAYEDYYASTRDLIKVLLCQGRHPIFMDQMSAMGRDEVAHATAVAHLALTLGLRLEEYLISQRKRLAPHHAKDVVNLGVAGMLHDLGKCKLPEALHRYNSIDTPDDAAARAEWETHPRIAYDLIQGGVESTAASAVLHHHQRFDGTGFPAAKPAGGADARPQGPGIHVFARILFAADLYDRLACPRDAHGRRSNLVVHHLMRTRYAAWLDPVVFQALQSVAPPFLPGTRVSLSDGTSAVVVDVKPDAPYAPVVKRFRTDKPGLDAARLDLRSPGAPAVVAAAGVDVRGMVAAAGQAA